MNATPTKRWTIDDSEQLYRIADWGDPYFSISSAGHLTVSPQGDRGGSIDLYELVKALRERNLPAPILIRFPDIMEDRLERLQSAFSRAITRYGYTGTYQGVFPVKCNQQRHLVEGLVRAGQRHQFGLEAGSKPELLIALALLNTPGALLVCNGYKDREYIETAILATKLDIKPFVVLEQLQEMEMVLETSLRLHVDPNVGVRAKLTSKGEGHWGETVGDRAKFGLTVPEILHTVERLREADKLQCLRLLHFHIGSQVSSIQVIKDALREACQIYVSLVKLGAPMGYLDVGGGLAVDYDGSKTNFHASKNYNIQNYANDVVAAVKDACVAHGIEMPILISESGRALASHQSVLVFDVLGISEVTREEPPEPRDGEPTVIANLHETLRSVSPDNAQEMFNDANQFKKEAITQFNYGILSLAQRGEAERIYWAVCRKLQGIVRGLEFVPEDLEGLEKAMASIYYVNLSVFQSAPDTWGMDQLFPIVPIHRLDEEPTERATLADLTCDSDGKFDKFIDLKDVKSLLEVHPLKPTGGHGTRFEPYYLALFLAGAYQEIMGSLHNLFGDTNAVHIRLTPHGYSVEHVVRGDTMHEVLSYVQYNGEDVIERVRKKTEAALVDGRISLQESQALLNSYEESLRRYTYLSLE